MEENEFKSFYQDINQMPCIYQKAILSTRCECPHAHKINLAEREVVACEFAEARQQCQALYSTFIEKARFALHKADNAALTHAETIKVQVGGITGLQKILNDTTATPRVGNLIMKAFIEYPELEGLPVDVIIRSIVHCQVRKRRKPESNKLQ